MDSAKQSAALCLLRLYRTSPHLVPTGDWASRVVHLLNDQHLVSASGRALPPETFAGMATVTQSAWLLCQGGTHSAPVGPPAWGDELDVVSGSPGTRRWGTTRRLGADSKQRSAVQ